MAAPFPLQLDRMAVEEVGLNPEKLAAAIHTQLSLAKGPVPVHEIARALDIIEIREEPLSNLEGMLLTTSQRSEGAILVNGRSSYERRRFTVAHELGHFLISSHRPVSEKGFYCTAADMVTAGDLADLNRRQEAEANRFAIALLAPLQLVRRYLNRSPDLIHVLAIAAELQISKEAAARRYIELHSESLAVIFCRDNQLIYYARGRDFPAICLSKDALLPIDPEIEEGQTTDMDAVEAADWLWKPAGIELYAQILAQQDARSIILLHAEAADAPDMDDTYERFHRR